MFDLVVLGNFFRSNFHPVRLMEIFTAVLRVISQFAEVSPKLRGNNVVVPKTMFEPVLISRSSVNSNVEILERFRMNGSSPEIRKDLQIPTVQESLLASRRRYCIELGGYKSPVKFLEDRRASVILRCARTLDTVNCSQGR